jgi:hypothetical protein
VFSRDLFKRAVAQLQVAGREFELAADLCVVEEAKKGPERENFGRAGGGAAFWMTVTVKVTVTGYSGYCAGCAGCASGSPEGKSVWSVTSFSHSRLRLSLLPVFALLSLWPHSRLLLDCLNPRSLRPAPTHPRIRPSRSELP